MGGFMGSDWSHRTWKLPLHREAAHTSNAAEVSATSVQREGVGG